MPLAEEGGLRLLLPPDPMDHYVGPEHLDRFIDAFVDGPDFSHSEFRRLEMRATGRRIPKAVLSDSAGTLL